jgi:hypothetical protein
MTSCLELFGVGLLTRRRENDRSSPERLCSPELRDTCPANRGRLRLGRETGRNAMVDNS